VPGRRPALRFMESLLSLPRMHWDHEPTPSPSLEGNGQDADRCLFPSWEGLGVGRFMESLLVAIALMTLPLAGLAEKKPGEAASLDKVEIQGEVKPGGNIVAVVHVKLEKDWHVQSNKPSEPSFIPTVLNLSPTPGVKLGTMKYPEGKSEKVQGLAKPLSVYDGDFQVSALLTLDANARLPLTIPATLNYQACQGATCYPPKKLKFDVVIGGEGKKK